MRKNLIDWQWSDYFEKHQNPLNLILHIFAVPLFWIGIILLLKDLWIDAMTLVTALACLFVSFAIQGVGHKLENENPAEFLGASDFVTRFFAEQFVTFPRFVLSGKWFKALFKK